MARLLPFVPKVVIETRKLEATTISPRRSTATEAEPIGKAQDRVRRGVQIQLMERRAA